jgi:hypothetical protein
MSYNPNRYNGIKHRKILRARLKVLKRARRDGFVTNAVAKKIGKWHQAWFHLNAMAEAGYLVHDGYNKWKPAKRGPGRPRLNF